MPKQKIIKRLDGRFRVKYKGIQFYGHTPTEAVAKRDEYKKQELLGLKFSSKDISFSDYSVKWLNIYKSNSSVKTYNRYAYIINRMIDFFQDKKVKEILTTDVKEYYSTLDGFSSSQITKHKNTLNNIFSSAVYDGIILKNPCYKVQTPQGYSGTHRNLEQWEQDIIVKMQDKHILGPMMMTMLYAGLRRGEALALDIDRDIDFENNIITVREAISFVSNQPILKEPKTASGFRTIPLLPPLKSCLQGKHGLLLPHTDKYGNPTHSTLAHFTSLYKSYINQAEVLLNGCQKRWYGKKKEHLYCDLPEWQTFNVRTHDLRHTFATMLYNNNIDIKTAQKWLGHSSTDMILKIYAHLTVDRETKAANFLINAFKDNK